MYSKVLWYCSSIDNDLDENVNMDLLSQSLNCVNTTTTSTTSEATTSQTQTEATTSEAQTEATNSEAQTEATTSEAQTEATTSEAQREETTSEAPGSSLATVQQEGQYGVWGNYGACYTEHSNV